MTERHQDDYKDIKISDHIIFHVFPDPHAAV